MKIRERERGTALLMASIIILVTATFASLLIALPKAALDGQKLSEDKEGAYGAANAAVGEAVAKLTVGNLTWVNASAQSSTGNPSVATLWPTSVYPGTTQTLTSTNLNGTWTQNAPKAFGPSDPTNSSGYWYALTQLDGTTTVKINAFGYKRTASELAVNPNTGQSSWTAGRVTVQIEAILSQTGSSPNNFGDMGALNLYSANDWATGNTPHKAIFVNQSQNGLAISGSGNNITLPAGFPPAGVDANPGLTFGGQFGDANHDNLIVMNSGASSTSIGGANSGGGPGFYTDGNNVQFAGNSTIPHNATGGAYNTGGGVSQNAGSSMQQIFTALEALPNAGTSDSYYYTSVPVQNIGTLVSSAANPKIIHVNLAGAANMGNDTVTQNGGSFYGIIYVDARNYTGPIQDAFAKLTNGNFYGLVLVDGPTALTDWFANNSAGMLSLTGPASIVGTAGFKDNGPMATATTGSGNFTVSHTGGGSTNAFPAATITGTNNATAVIQYSSVVVGTVLQRLNITTSPPPYQVVSYRVLPATK